MAIEKLTDLQIRNLIDWTGSCNPMEGEHIVTGDDFTLLDIQKLSDEYFYGRCDEYLHMSNVHEGDLVQDPKNVKGWICFKSLEEVGNRKFADRLAENCEKVLKSQKKCDALRDVVEKYAEEPFWKTALKWILGGMGAIGSGILIFFVIGPIVYKKIFGNKPPDDHDDLPPPSPAKIGLPSGASQSDAAAESSADVAKSFLYDAGLLQLLGNSGAVYIPRTPVVAAPKVSKVNVGRAPSLRSNFARGAGGLFGLILMIGIVGPERIENDMENMGRYWRYQECIRNPSSECMMEFPGTDVGRL